MNKPGEKALIALKQQDKQVHVFKKPNVPQIKKKKSIILTEEKYMEELGKIIQRDFFPDLEKLNAQNEYLDAIASNDMVKLRRIFSKYNSKTPLGRGILSPATFETPLPNISSPVPSEAPSVLSTSSQSSTKSNKTIADRHTLDSFLQNYSSEDDDSFQEIIEAADLKLRQKFANLYEAEEKSKETMKSNLALPSIEKQFGMIEGVKPVDMWTYKNKNSVMYIPDGVELTKEEQLEMAKRKMEIMHNNTRLSANPFNEHQSKTQIAEAAKLQSKTAGDKIGVDGKSISNTDSPNIRGFSFVKTPSPCPGVTDSPLFTWGEIEGTPFRLDGGDTPLPNTTAGPSFRIAEASKRETLALQLAGNVTEQARQKKAKAMETARRNISSPFIRSTLDRLASMSPAAKQLASSKLRILATPSPMRSAYRTPRSSSSKRKVTPSPSFVRRKTPLINPATPTSKTRETITDNLLAIPTNSKRQKAADFF